MYSIIGRMRFISYYSIIGRIKVMSYFICKVYGLKSNVTLFLYSSERLDMPIKAMNIFSQIEMSSLTDIRYSVWRNSDDSVFYTVQEAIHQHMAFQQSMCHLLLYLVLPEMKTNMNINLESSFHLFLCYTWQSSQLLEQLS